MIQKKRCFSLLRGKKPVCVLYTVGMSAKISAEAVGVKMLSR